MVVAVAVVVVVCVTLEITRILLECTAWLFTLFVRRGKHMSQSQCAACTSHSRHGTRLQTVSNKAMQSGGYPAWPVGRTCNNFKIS